MSNSRLDTNRHLAATVLASEVIALALTAVLDVNTRIHRLWPDERFGTTYVIAYLLFLTPLQVWIAKRHVRLQTHILEFLAGSAGAGLLCGVIGYLIMDITLGGPQGIVRYFENPWTTLVPLLYPAAGLWSWFLSVLSACVFLALSVYRSRADD